MIQNESFLLKNKSLTVKKREKKRGIHKLFEAGQYVEKFSAKK